MRLETKEQKKLGKPVVIRPTILFLFPLFYLLLNDSFTLEDYYQLLIQNKTAQPEEMPPQTVTAPIVQEPHPTDPFPETSKQDLKKKKFVPWEPFKAAPAADRKGSQPENLPEKLIPYKTNGEVDDVKSLVTVPLVDTRRLMMLRAERIEESDVIAHLEEQLQAAETQILIERDLNTELKRLLVATVDDDWQCHVNSLSQDKVTLARRLDQYANKLQNEDEEMEALKIERDVWKCKFLAMSIRVDEVKARNETLLKILRCAQHTISDIGSNGVVEELKERIASFTSLDLSRLVERSPAEEKYSRPAVNYHNLTIACCKNCTGREIHLL
ncbi:unnamed protein product, partial [Mesorhabditis belari]|uniref:Golgin-45 n=1 Tax=Mesorhabditis belari TaxID=2138241 RepID=A0AAF3EBG8_9BILA